MTTVAGPIGRLATFTELGAGAETVSRLEAVSGGRPAASEANATLLLRRVACIDTAAKETRAAALRDRASASMFPRQLLNAARKRRAAAVARLRDRGRTCREFRVRPMWRMVIGLGEENPAEFGMRLHPTYGTPIIPGTALKGVTRAHAREAASADDVAGVFGHPSGEGGDDAAVGSIMFLDALPDPPGGSTRRVVTDLVNPHVGGYYQSRGATPPAEYLQPVPSAFLAVSSTVWFRVHVVGRPGADIELMMIEEWLPAALDELGVGAKTAAGYGYLEVEPVEDAADVGDGTGRSGGDGGRR